jgi:hypothetical protein
VPIGTAVITPMNLTDVLEPRYVSCPIHTNEILAISQPGVSSLRSRPFIVRVDCAYVLNYRVFKAIIAYKTSFGCVTALLNSWRGDIPA